MTDSVSHAAAEPARPSKPVGHSLHIKILMGLIVGAVLGIGVNYGFSRSKVMTTALSVGLGVATNAVAPGTQVTVGTFPPTVDFILKVAEPLGQVFLRLMLMVVVPLVFAALSLGVVGLGDVRRLGKIGLRTLVLTLCFSFSAVAIGILLVDTIKPGSGLPDEKRAELQQHYGKGAMKRDKDSQEAKVVESNLEKAKQAKSLSDTLLDMIPKNPLQEMVGALDGSSPGNGMLAVMFFALVFGIALAAIPAERGATMIAWLEGLYDICMVIISFTMRLAPFCVACLVFAITARLGADILQSLFWFVITVVLGLTLHLTVVYSIMLATVGGRNPLQFFRDVSEAMVTAFATSSSSATLPTALRVAHEDLKIPKELANFVMTVGATGNQNGTALYEGVVVLFLAQVFGVELNLSQQITVVLMSVLAGVGTAGVPGGSLPLIVLVLQSVGVPGEGIGIILGIDRFLDMARTVLNVTGDLAIAACVARWEQRSPTGVPLVSSD